MNRSEFIARLEQALRNMPEEERRRAVEYYENYFDEAGVENEADVLDTLGAPEKVAADILREFRDVNSPAGAAQNEKSGGTRRQTWKNRFSAMDRGQKLLVLMLAAVALVCVVPVALGVIGGVGGLLIGLICAVAAVFLIAPILDFVAWVCAIVFAAMAVYFAVTAVTADALFLAGLALISAAFGIWFWKLTVYLFRKVFPALLNGIVGLFRRVVHPNEKGGQK